MTNDSRQNIPAEVQKTDSSGSGGAPSPAGAGASCHQGGGLSFLKMAACCAVPILLLAALPLFGGVLGITGASLLSTLAFLACPAAMGFMMWRMSRQQVAGAKQAGPPVPLTENVFGEQRQVSPPTPLAENVLEEPAKEIRS